MHIQLQFCGFIIVTFLLVLYKTHRTLQLPEEKIFLRMLLLTIACISLDAISVVAIYYHTNLPLLLVQACCKAYLLSLIWVGFINFLYVFLDLKRDESNYKRLTKIMTVVTLLQSAVVILLPIGIHQQEDEIYTFGASVICTYIFTLFYVVSTLNVAIYIYQKKNSRRGLSIIMTTSLWILAAIIQFLNNEILLVGFSMAVGVMILYIVMENPDAFLDRILGCFNAYALHSYLSMKMDTKQSFCVMDISIKNSKLSEDNPGMLEEKVKEFIHQATEDSSIKLFKNISEDLVLVTDSDNNFQYVRNILSNLSNGYEIFIDNLTVFSIRRAEEFESTDELLKFVTYARNNPNILYAEKENVSESMIHEYKNIFKTEETIDLALKEDRVEAYLQPIVSIKKQRIVSAEALVRIRNTDGSILSPGSFIPVAESSGQIIELGERVLSKVCEFLKNSNALEYGIESIHVNLSVVQCENRKAVTKLYEIVKSHEVDPGLINFEITETAVSSSKEIMLENMNYLIEHGFKFALDDFGKGESNLMYIVEMPVDIIKLDMDMSKAFFENEKAKIVVDAVTDMAHKMDLPIVAEGIENKNEADEISAEGITHIQGYYYSRPLPMDDFMIYLKNKVNAATV